ncbi:MAG: hypothetical protein M3Y48_05020 [Actinomycetota bacterium]|nr:hypothetical protein [Actinomycetota bacterium]
MGLRPARLLGGWHGQHVDPALVVQDEVGDQAFAVRAERPRPHCTLRVVRG